MSILLEALRKSEKSKRAREVPTIHAEEEPEATPETMATGPLALMLVVALFISGWFVWHQYQAPATAGQPTQADVAQSTDTPDAGIDSRTPTTEAPASSDGDGITTEGTQPSTARRQTPPPTVSNEPATVKAAVPERLRASRSATQKAATEKSSSAQRTPMESYQPPVTSTPKTQANTPKPSADAGPTADTPDKADEKPAVSEKKTMASLEAPRPKPKPEEPLPMGYWELPDSVRSNVPEIKFSVLVYAANPAERFVLINGERLTEGDTAGPDLVVKEIRREGVIFTYRLYQFLVER